MRNETMNVPYYWGSADEIETFPYEVTREALTKTANTERKISILRFQILDHFSPGSLIHAGRIATSCAVRSHFVTCSLYGLLDRGFVRQTSSLKHVGTHVFGCRYVRTRRAFSTEYRKALLEQVNTPASDVRMPFNCAYCRSLIREETDESLVVDIIAARVRKYYREGEAIPVFMLADGLYRDVDTLYSVCDRLVRDGYVEKRDDAYFRTGKDSFHETPLYWR